MYDKIKEIILIEKRIKIKEELMKTEEKRFRELIKKKKLKND